MESSKYLEDIASIKNMMHKSSRFMSLSGLSGILAGLYALIAAAIAHHLVSGMGIFLMMAEPTGVVAVLNDIVGGGLNHLSGSLLLLMAATLVMAIVTGIILTKRKAKKHDEKIWDASSKRLLLNFLVPLFTGGAFCIVLIQYGIVGLLAPATLIFYGLALINASKFTLGDIKFLGIANVIIGLISTQFIGYGLYFWALGFGVFHIIYGTIMYRKYDRI